MHNLKMFWVGICVFHLSWYIVQNLNIFQGFSLTINHSCFALYLFIKKKETLNDYYLKHTNFQVKRHSQ